MSESNGASPKRVLFVDALRGVAAMGVVIHHYNAQLNWHLLDYGKLGVPMFFVLSGFVIAMNVGERPPVSAGYLGRFALRRAMRLDPPYWLSMFAVLVIGYLGAEYGIKHEPPSVGQILSHLVYLQGWLDYENIQGVYWTLCHEVQFYIALILLLWMRGSTGWMLVGTLAVSLLDRRLEFTDSAFMGRFWFCFALGALTFYCSRSVIRQQAFFWLPLILVATFGAVFGDSYAITATGTSLALYLVISLGATKLGSSAPLQFLGRISYSLYVTHLIVGWLALRVAEKFIPTEAAVVFGTAVALVSAWVFYVLVERPSVRFSKLVELAPTARGMLDKAHQEPAK